MVAAEAAAAAAAAAAAHQDYNSARSECFTSRNNNNNAADNASSRGAVCICCNFPHIMIDDERQSSYILCSMSCVTLILTPHARAHCSHDDEADRQSDCIVDWRLAPPASL